MGWLLVTLALIHLLRRLQMILIVSWPRAQIVRAGKFIR